MRFATFLRQTTLIEGRVKKIIEHVKIISSNQNADTLTDPNRKKCIQYYATILKCNNELENLVNKLAANETSETELNEVLEIQDRFDELVLLGKGEIECLVPNINNPSDTDLNVSSHAHPSDIPKSVIKLPTLELPTFNGDLTTWSAWYNLFDNTIHQSKTLSNVEKHTYLLSCLQEEALNLVKNLPISSANYLIAFNLLLERYQNIRRLVTLHVNRIIDLPNMHGNSLKTIRNFIDVFTENSQALKALNYNVTNELTLLAILLRKLDNNLRQRFESLRDSQHTVPTVFELIRFLESEASNLENAQLSWEVNKTTSMTRNSQPHFKPKFNNPQPKMVYDKSKQSFHLNAKFQTICTFCTQDTHTIYKCPKFTSLAVNERVTYVKRNKLCSNCLSNKHLITVCKSTSTCRICQMKHHTLLHTTRQSQPQTVQGQDFNKQIGNITDAHSSHAQSGNLTLTNTTCSSERSIVTLGTVKVLISNNKATKIVRGICDSGSMVTLISYECASSLKLKIQPTNIILNTVGDFTTEIKGITKINLYDVENNLIIERQRAIVVTKITSNLPNFKIPLTLHNKIKHLKLADPEFNTPQQIDLLLGADVFKDIVTGTKINFGKQLPCAIHTVFGYMILGALEINVNSVVDLPTNISLLNVSSIDLNKTLQDFWKVEEPPTSKLTSPDDEACELYYKSSVTRDYTGRYITTLPFKLKPTTLGESYDSAKRRYLALENKLNYNPQLKEAYTNFIDEYIQLGHMSRADDSILTQSHYILPHHAVYKETSSTTKLRVVFDASARTTSGLSLNDTLYCGGKLQNDVSDVIFHFRKHNIVFACDIKMMYRQINIAPADQKYQLILWRSEKTEPLEIYKLNTVTYGCKSAPFLAIRTLHQLALDEGQSFPAATELLKNNLYMDDFLVSAPDVDSALSLQKELISFLNKGQFQLRKWSSNNNELLNSVPPDFRETPLHFCNSDQLQISILGLKWSPTNDVFSYAINIPQHTYTKRSLLSLIARIYDPCGFLTPITFYAKCLIQLLWCSGFSWDMPLTPNLTQRWKTFISELPQIQQLKIPRYLYLSDATEIQLHGFSDSSEAGYAAVVYLRVIDSNNEVKINILSAKSKVAPLKKLSIPRLELCAAHLLAKLMNYSLQLIQSDFTVNAIHCWSDSTIVLNWIKTPPYRLKVYVANRVSQIQDWVSSDHWNHVSTACNPADCATRVISPSALLSHPLWWNGPKWLKLSAHDWPNAPAPVLDNLPELRANPLLIGVARLQDWDLWNKFSKWTTLKRVVAYIYRFIQNARQPTRIRSSGTLTLTELNMAENNIIRQVQQEHFASDIKALLNNQPCSVALQRLKPFLDEHGIIRVGGRIKHSSQAYDHKHPMVMPKKHTVTKLLINYYHIKYLHAGPQLMQAMLSLRYWIISARSAIRTCIFKCVTCFRTKPKQTIPLMGDLPSKRLKPSRPFLTTGIDFAGPFLVKVHTLRNAKTIKVYLCVFVCFVTKAVHLEVANDLSTDAFIDAFHRFTSRRGLCSDVYTDCGTNFIGSARKLNHIYHKLLQQPDAKTVLSDFASKEGTRFHFLPPASPHMGGIWESAVKNAKHHLTRMLRTQVLPLTSFITLVTRVEAMLNSRPLTPMSNDPSDLRALTPGHFLIGQPLAALPEEDIVNIPANRLKHWQLVQQLTQQLWKRWILEYLHTLQQRSKWMKPTGNLKINDLVLIHEPNAHPLHWPMGRITNIHPGNDGVVRVVTIQMSTGSLTRPATKVFRLPLEEDSSQFN